MDRIHIRRLPVKCVVGVYPRERRTKQKVYATIALHCDLRPAGQSDKLEDTIDYAAITKRIVAEAGKSRYYLLEALAQHIASICLAEKRVKAVDVAVEKSRALPAPVSVEIHRSGDEP